LFQGSAESREPAAGIRDVSELARRLAVAEEELRAARQAYKEFSIPKRSGGKRTIASPEPALKALQRRILRRVLARLRCHPAATGFEKHYSIAINAMAHVHKAVVVRMDIRDFFGSIKSARVQRYFQRIGWNTEAARLLTTICIYRGALPQGAPTSPRLSNLLCYRLDARLTALARRYQAAYSRYADDMTFSWGEDNSHNVHAVTHLADLILSDEGYELHWRKKLHISRRHDRQIVTGLVVNERVNLPRKTRRRLRAIGHHHKVGRPATLTPAQLAGWQAIEKMIKKQAVR
jgi:retron-type reverse transcriptase